MASLVLTQPGTGDALRALLIDAVNEAAAVQGDLLERLQSMFESGDVNSTDEQPRVAARRHRRCPTRATRRAPSTPPPACCWPSSAPPPRSITETLLGPRPALVEAYARHRRSDARGEDAAAALFGISTQGPHHEAARDFVVDARRRAHPQRLWRAASSRRTAERGRAQRSRAPGTSG